MLIGFAVWLLSGCGDEQTRYVKFLHRYMTSYDERVYKPEFWEENVAKSLEVRDRMRWEYPADYFRYFVLPVRVGDEPLDRFRTTYADSLCSLVEGMDPERAVFEINSWCRLQAYFSEDAETRTLSPMGTMDYGFGLCSDLTVLTVNAMRAAGFPARQVTTTWSDFRSNHSWVEVYVGGRWAMMVGCEPYARLDTNAWVYSRRVMNADCTVFGNYHGPETVLSRDGHVTRISNLSKYAAVKKTSVAVYDSTGRPVKGAEVTFLMYHKGGIVPLFSSTTDAHGRATMETGYGDLVALAYKDGLFGMARVAGDTVLTHLLLAHDIRSNTVSEFELSPPPELPDKGPLRGNDECWAPIDSARLERLAGHPFDEARAQAYIDEPRRPHIPEVGWTGVNGTPVRFLGDSTIVWGEDLSVYRLEGSRPSAIVRPLVTGGTYLVVTGTGLSEDDRYMVRMETFTFPEGSSEVNIPVTMPAK